MTEFPVFRKNTSVFTFLFALCVSAASDVAAQSSFVVMELNAENFFDPSDNASTKDDDFTAKAARTWTWRKFWQKTNNVSKIIAAAGGDKPVDLVALCEVENDSVMECLTRFGALRRLRYEYVITHSEDVRGLNVALIYNPQTFKVLSSCNIHPDFSGLPRKKSRNVLYVSGMVLTGDTLDMFVCHFPSRLDRRKSGKEYRMRLARQLKRHVDSIFTVRVRPNIIITGDFNDTPADKSLSEGLGAVAVSSVPDITESNRLYNIVPKPLENSVGGTYYYKGVWETLDNFIVSGMLLDAQSGLHTTCADCGIFAPEFLLSDSEGAKIPKRTYRGYKYNNGFSDHLPVVATFHYSW